MKKALLGTTALVAAGLVAQNAQAADPISLSLGGGQTWGFSVADYDNEPKVGDVERDDFSFHTSTKIVFKGGTVLDNGLGVNVLFELEGESKPGDQMDKTRLDVEGSFGEFRVGNDFAASYKMSTAAPYASYVFGLNTATFAVANSPTLSTYGAAHLSKFTQVMYFTPVFNGFQFGASWGPEVEQLNESTGNSGAQPDGNEAWTAGARYDGELGDVGLTLAGGYSSQDVMGADGAADSDVTDYNIGAVVSFDTITVGGSYRVHDKDDGSDDTTSYDVGVRYSEGGPWAVSLVMGNTEGGSTDNDLYRLSGTYSLGAGVSVIGAVGINKTDDGANDSSFVGSAISVSF